MRRRFNQELLVTTWNHDKTIETREFRTSNKRQNKKFAEVRDWFRSRARFEVRSLAEYCQCIRSIVGKPVELQSKTDMPQLRHILRRSREDRSSICLSSSETYAARDKMLFSEYIKKQAVEKKVSHILIREELVFDELYLVIAALVNGYRVSVFISTHKSWYTCNCIAYKHSRPCSHIYAALLEKDRFLNERN